MYLYMGGNETDEGAVSGSLYNELVKIGYPKDRIVADKYDAGEHSLAYWRSIYPEFLETMYTRNVSGLTLGALIDEKRLITEEDENSTRKEGPGGDYVCFDDSETKWDNVNAYWWEKSFSTTTNKITGEVYGESWPGLPMERVGDTDIYRIVIPVGANSIIFNSGKTDQEVAD